ncbi:MAG: hypothetical protein WBR10_20420 [Candidatus Acidiferrum sp.]
MDSASSEAQASITIRRQSPEDVQQRQIVVKLDGESVGELFYGDTISIPVTAGHHRLRVDNTWNWKTVELDVSPGDHLKFQTMSRAGRLTWFLVSMFGAGPIYVSIQREE